MKFSQHLATNILLSGVLLFLVLIWHRMPPKGTIDVEVRNRRPLDVEVTNGDLHVEIDNIVPIPVTIEK